MKFHGEYNVRLSVEVVIDADTLETAQKAVKSMHFDVNDCGDVIVRGWDSTPESVYLFEGEE